MFPELDPYPVPERLIDDLARRMVDDGAGPGHASLPAGYTYFGQFVDHDLSFDPVSRLRLPNDPGQVEDFRTPRFDLDMLYGSGPRDMPYLYARDAPPGRELLLIGDSRAQFGDGFAAEDLPRNADGRALIGDPRNDENVIIAQLHLAFLKLHNRVVRELDGGGHASHWSGRPSELFWEAQRIVRWHYQWVVARDFLPRILPGGRAGRTRRRLRPFGFDGEPFMPVEFAVGAYRFGHTLVRPSYQINARATGVQLFAAGRDRLEADHLDGFRSLPGRLVIDWARFLRLPGGAPPQPARRLDTRLSRPLARLPAGVAPPGEAGRSLAWLNLTRGSSMGLPSGQAVAEALGTTPLDDDTLQLARAPAPLWFYVLAEAETIGEGQRLGPVGGAIVGEVMQALLTADPASFLHADPPWTPFLGPDAGSCGLADLLAYAAG